MGVLGYIKFKESDEFKDIFDIDDVDGALVGGASLKSEDFMSIINAC